MSGRQRLNRPTHPYAPISAASQTAEPRKIIQEDPGEAVFQTMDAAPPVRSTRPPRSVKAYVHWHLSSDTLSRNLYRPAPLILVAFITGNSSLEPLNEGLYAQIHVNLR